MGNPKLKLLLATAILLLSFLNKAFGWFRSFEYLQHNAPSLFAVINSAAFQLTMVAVGLSCAAVGLYEIWKRRGSASVEPGMPPQQQTQLRAQGNDSVAATVGSIGKIGRGATVIVSSGSHGKEGIKPAPIQPPRARPNLNYCGFRRTDVFISPWAFIGVREPTNDEESRVSICAVILKFENDLWPDGGGRRAMDVLAQVVYRCADGSSLRIDYGVWLGSSIRFETIDIGDTRELLLVLRMKKDDNRDSEYAVFNDKRDLNDHFPDGFSWFRNETIREPHLAEVTIVEVQSRSKYVFDFEISVAAAGLEIALRKVTRPGQT
jgi:hypothetical protein